MEEDVEECLVLKTFLGREPPCRQTCTHKEFPSYHHNGCGKGCWVAHTVLCILEATRVRNEVTRILEKRGIKWNVLLLTLLLHDSGKLSKDYISRNEPSIHHNEVSAQVAYEILRRLNKGGNYLTGSERKAICQACYLHMEYYEWRSMSRGAYASLSQATHPPGTIVELSDEVEKPLRNLELLLKEINAFDETILVILREIQNLRSVRLRPSVYVVDKSTPPEVLLKTIALQWFILLFDNRASTARRGIDSYWSRLFADARRSLVDRGISSEAVIEFSDNLLRTLKGKVTPLPKSLITSPP